MNILESDDLADLGLCERCLGELVSRAATLTDGVLVQHCCERSVLIEAMAVGGLVRGAKRFSGVPPEVGAEVVASVAAFVERAALKRSFSRDQ